MIVIRTEVSAYGTADPRSALAVFERLNVAGERPYIHSSMRRISIEELRARAAT